MDDEAPVTFGKAIQTFFGSLGFILLMIGLEHFRDNGFSYTDLGYVVCGGLCDCAVATWFAFKKNLFDFPTPVKRILVFLLILIFTATIFLLVHWYFTPRVTALASAPQSVTTAPIATAASVLPNTVLPAPNPTVDTPQIETVLNQPPPSFPERPGLTMSGIEIMYFGRGTAVGPCGGIIPSGKGLLMDNMGITSPSGMPPNTGIETGDNSPVISNGTDIEATHGIKTGNGSSVATFGGSIRPAPTLPNKGRTILYVMGGDGPCPGQNVPTASSSTAPAQPPLVASESTGIETGSGSPVVTNGTPIEADHGIKTGDNSPATTNGGSIRPPQH